jgi:hypothetical protein
MREWDVGRPCGSRSLAVFLLIWAGMLIGVSAIATPVKFGAPLLTLPVALDVGRTTFHAFSRIECVLGVVAALTGGFTRPRPSLLQWSVITLVMLIVALQALWLLPALDARVTAVIAGSRAPPGIEHRFYILADVFKLCMLLAIAIPITVRR